MEAALEREEASQAGRRGQALARFEVAGGRTILRDSFSRVPLQILRPHYPEGGDPAHLTLVNPTGGYVMGDVLETEVELGGRAWVLWTSQGAAKVYRSLGAPVVSTMTIRLAAGARMELLPDALIPYRGSIYRQEVRAELAEGAVLLYGEMLHPGREASGERFGYDFLGMRFTASLEGRPLVTDALEARPAKGGVERLGLLEPHAYLGSFYALGGEEAPLQGIADRVTEAIAGMEDAVGGATRLDGPGVLVRWLARTPRRLRHVHGLVWDTARRALLGREAVRFRKF